MCQGTPHTASSPLTIPSHAYGPGSAVYKLWSYLPVGTSFRGHAAVLGFPTKVIPTKVIAIPLATSTVFNMLFMSGMAAQI